jgi:hypothetical protein
VLFLVNLPVNHTQTGSQALLPPLRGIILTRNGSSILDAAATGWDIPMLTRVLIHTVDAVQVTVRAGGAMAMVTPATGVGAAPVTPVTGNTAILLSTGLM